MSRSIKKGSVMRQFLSTLLCAVVVCFTSVSYSNVQAESFRVACQENGDSYKVSVKKGVTVLEQYDAQGMFVCAVGNNFGGAISLAASLCLQADGNIVVVARISTQEGPALAVARYRSNDLVLDTSFGNSGIFSMLLDHCADTFIPSVVVQADKKIIITGVVSSQRGQQLYSARLSSNGCIDPTFGRYGCATVALSDNVVGAVYSKLTHQHLYIQVVPHDEQKTPCMIRMFVDGTCDRSFGQSGKLDLIVDQGMHVTGVCDVSAKDVMSLLVESDDSWYCYRYAADGTVKNVIRADRPVGRCLIDAVSMADGGCLLVTADDGAHVGLCTLMPDGTLQPIADRAPALQMYVRHRMQDGVKRSVSAQPVFRGPTGPLTIEKIFCYEGCCPMIFGYRDGSRVIISKSNGQVIEEPLCVQDRNDVFLSDLTLEEFEDLVADCDATCDGDSDNPCDFFAQTWTIIDGIQDIVCQKFEQTWTIIAGLQDSLQFDELFTAIVQDTTIGCQKFMETWTMLAPLDLIDVSLNITVSTDLSPVFTALSQFEQIACEKFMETWTIMAHLGETVDLSSFYTALVQNQEILDQKFQQTWTLLADVQADLCSKFQQTWTALDELEAQAVEQFQQTWTVIEAFDATLSMQFDQVFADLAVVEQLVMIVTTSQMQEYLLTLSILNKLCTEVVDTLTEIVALSLEIEATFTTLDEFMCDKFMQTWTAIVQTQNNLIDAIDLQTTIITQDFQGTWTALEALEALMCDNFMQTWTIIDFIQNPLCGVTPLFAAGTISTAGTYCVANDIVGNITIAVNNVILDLNGHQLSGGGTETITINSGISNVTIRNGYLASGGASNGIHLLNSNTNILIENVTITDYLFGMLLDGGGTGSKFIKISNSPFKGPSGTAGDAGIDITNANQVLIENCCISDYRNTAGPAAALTSGIKFDTVTNAKVIGCQIRDNYYQGIRMVACQTCVIESCIITNALSPVTGRGIRLRNTASSDIVINNNLINQNGGAGVGGSGIQVDIAVSRTQISNNQINNNPGGGIVVSATGSLNDASITNNMISGSTVTNAGISFAAASSRIVIENNEISNNSIGGIRCAAAVTNASIKNNLIAGNATNGGISFATTASSNIAVEGNTITGNTAGGGIVASVAMSDMTFKNNIISANTGSGISFAAASRSIAIENNQIADNTVNGIEATNGLSQSAIVGNQIVGSGSNQAIGINLLGTSNAVCIEDNCIARHTGGGIVATALTSAVMKHNEIDRNGSDGILVTGASTDIAIQDNSITGNTGDGLEISNGTLVTISKLLIANNTITGNGNGTAHGITITPTAAVTVTFQNSTIQNNMISGNTIGVNIVAATGTLTAQQLCVQGNSVLGNSSHGIRTSANNSIFTNNQVLNNNINGAALSGGIVTTSTASGCTYRGNVCNNNGGSGATNAGIISNAINCTFDHNECSGNSANGILLNATSDTCTVSNNICSNNTDRAIRIESGSSDHNFYKNICNKNDSLGFSKLAATDNCSFVLNKAHSNGAGTTNANYGTSTTIPLTTIGEYDLSANTLTGKTEVAGAAYTNLSIIV